MYPKEKYDQSFSLSRYIDQGDRMEHLRKDVMDKSDTQLLQSSPIIHENSSFCISSQESLHRPFVLKTHMDSTSFSDLGPSFLIDQQKGTFKQPQSSLEPIYQELMILMKQLQDKLDRGTDNLLQSLGNYSNASTIKFPKGCSFCDSWKNILLELAQAKGQLKLYAIQMDQVTRQMSDLRLENNQIKIELKKNKVQNSKMKELLRQYKNYLKNKEAKNNQYNIHSQNNLENSLDRRLREEQKQLPAKRPDFTNMIPTQSIFSIDTPKTPHNFRYRSCQNLIASQKTQPRTNVKSHQLKQILEFQQKSQVSQDNFLRGKIQQRAHYKYPFNELLEITDLHCKEDQSDILALDHFSTMQSLPQSDDLHKVGFLRRQ